MGAEGAEKDSKKTWERTAGASRMKRMESE